MITLTPPALDRIRAALKREAPEGAGLRIGVVGGGCSGMSYKMAYETREKPSDEVFEFDGVRIFVDLKSYLYLNGTELDYVEGLLDSGFKFHNPNVKRACACGESFGI
jgi:iron-sulfur cluster assembly protein